MKKLITLLLVLTGIVTTANAATETTVYYAVPSSVVGTYTVKLNINRKGDGDDWAQYTMTKTDETFLEQDIYTYTYTDLYDGVGRMQFQLYNGDAQISQQQPIASWTIASTYNGKMYVHDVGWTDYNYDVTERSFIVHCKKTATWTPNRGYVYYNTGGDTETKLNGNWPGGETAVNTLYSEYYDLTITSSVNRTMVIFSQDNGGTAGTNQTWNIPIIGTDASEYWAYGDESKGGYGAGAECWAAKTTAPEEFDYIRSVTVGKFGTICLPYAATITGATVYEITGKIMDGTTFKGINLQSVEGTLTAGKPYIFKATSTTLTATLSGTKVDAATTDNNGLIGNLDATIKAPEDSYVLSNNKICRVAAANAVNVGQYKAYINVAGVPEVLAPTMDFIPFEDAEYSTTGISNAVKDAEAEGAIYNLNGQRVTSAQKGLFIINGKKLVIR